MRALVEYLRTLSANRVLHVEDAELAASQFLGLLNEPLLWLRVIGIGDAPSKERREKVVAEGVSMFLSRYGKRHILPEDRTSVVYGKSVSVRVDLGVRRIIKKKIIHNINKCRLDLTYNKIQ